jgi:hypothetical protein
LNERLLGCASSKTTEKYTSEYPEWNFDDDNEFVQSPHTPMTLNNSSAYNNCHKDVYDHLSEDTPNLPAQRLNKANMTDYSAAVYFEHSKQKSQDFEFHSHGFDCSPMDGTKGSTLNETKGKSCNLIHLELIIFL